MFLHLAKTCSQLRKLFNPQNFCTWCAAATRKRPVGKVQARAHEPTEPLGDSMRELQQQRNGKTQTLTARPWRQSYIQIGKCPQSRWRNGAEDEQPATSIRAKSQRVNPLPCQGAGPDCTEAATGSQGQIRQEVCLVGRGGGVAGHRLGCRDCVRWLKSLQVVQILRMLQLTQSYFSGGVQLHQLRSIYLAASWSQHVVKKTGNAHSEDELANPRFSVIYCIGF